MSAVLSCVICQLFLRLKNGVWLCRGSPETQRVSRESRAGTWLSAQPMAGTDNCVLLPHLLVLVPSSVCSGGGSGSATDLVFLIDGSKSVRPENFELVKKFINQIVDTLDVSDRLAQVGLVQYSSSVRQEFPLGRFHNKKDIKAAVRNMSYMEKGTMTGAALKYLIDNSFTVSSGARPGAQKVGIVFTDGRSQDYINDAARKAKDLGMYRLPGLCTPLTSRDTHGPGSTIAWLNDF